MAALVALLRSCMESFKSILTSQEFGAEYELLCTELSVQWLRIRLWGESVGLHFDEAGRLQESLFTRLDIESTVTSCVNSIAFLLSEIEVIRRNYELRPPLELVPDRTQNAEKSIHGCKSLGRLASIKTVASLRQRMRDNQKQKSFLAITKWAVCDSKKFDEKVKRLKVLVDGLDDVSKASGIGQVRPTRVPSVTIPPYENPPPYSFDPPTSHQAAEVARQPAVPPDQGLTRRQERYLSKHHAALKQHGLLSPDRENIRSARTHEKLVRLTNLQLYDLLVDVYDELRRRQQQGITLPYLPINASYHPKRNQARQKISTLHSSRFRDLTMDLVIELERRFPLLHLPAIPEAETTRHLSDPFSVPRNAETRRYGCVLPYDAPSPLLQQRRTLSHLQIMSMTDLARPHLTSRFSQSSTTLDQVSRPTYSVRTAANIPPVQRIPVDSRSSSNGSVEIFKSFRVSMEDPTYKVLPAALKKYNIDAPWETYALYLVYGDKERCLGLDEKPLVLFKTLDREGLKPMFMLRKIASMGAGVPQRPNNLSDPPGGVV